MNVQSPHCAQQVDWLCNLEGDVLSRVDISLHIAISPTILVNLFPMALFISRQNLLPEISIEGNLSIEPWEVIWKRVIRIGLEIYSLFKVQRVFDQDAVTNCVFLIDIEHLIPNHVCRSKAHVQQVHGDYLVIGGIDDSFFLFIFLDLLIVALVLALVLVYILVYIFVCILVCVLGCVNSFVLPIVLLDGSI